MIICEILPLFVVFLLEIKIPLGWDRSFNMWQKYLLNVTWPDNDDLIFDVKFSWNCEFKKKLKA